MSANVENLDGELKTALGAACVGVSFSSVSPGVSSGTLVGTRLWLAKGQAWVGVDFTEAPTSQQQTTAASTVAAHSPELTLLQKFRLLGGPPALHAKFLKDEMTARGTWQSGTTPGQKLAINAIIDAGHNAHLNVLS